MKTVMILSCLLFAGCMTAPKNVYVQPEKYNCDLIIPTIWDGNHPVKHFEHEIVVGHTYHDYYGMEYKLMPTKTPDVFILQVQVTRP